MLEGLGGLGWAGEVGAAVHGLALGADDGCAADWALGGHLEYALFTGSERGHGPEDLGNNLTGALDYDGIAYSDIAAVDVVLVVERGLFDGCATDYYGLQHRRRG